MQHTFERYDFPARTEYGPIPRAALWQRSWRRLRIASTIAEPPYQQSFVLEIEYDEPIKQTREPFSPARFIASLTPIAPDEIVNLEGKEGLDHLLHCDERQYLPAILYALNPKLSLCFNAETASGYPISNPRNYAEVIYREGLWHLLPRARDHCVAATHRKQHARHHPSDESFLKRLPPILGERIDVTIEYDPVSDGGAAHHCTLQRTEIDGRTLLPRQERRVLEYRRKDPPLSFEEIGARLRIVPSRAREMDTGAYLMLETDRHQVRAIHHPGVKPQQTQR